jgi:hypothetical protein
MEPWVSYGLFGLKNSQKLKNQKRLIKYFLLIIIISSSITFDFFRDYCFININFKLDFLNSLNNGNINAYNYTDSSFEYIFSQFDLNSLVKLKWIMSFCFSLIFYLIGLSFALVLFMKKNFTLFVKTQTFGLASLILLSLIFYLFSSHLPGEDRYILYYISLEFSHFAQSTLFPLVFLIVFYAYTNLNSST